MGERDRIGPTRGVWAPGAGGDFAGGQTIDSRHVYRLIYVSRNLVSPLASGGERMLRDILDISRERNRRVGITGALTFNDAHFSQVLEGPRNEVRKLFLDIGKDPRHRDVVVIEQGWIERRDFRQWAMAYVGGIDNRLVVSLHEDLRDVLAEDGRRGAELVELLKYHLVDE